MNESILTTLQNAYPSGIRRKTVDQTSVIYAYDVVRSYVLELLFDDLNLCRENISIQTITLEGIREWETFLGIPIDETASFDFRRTQILAKLAGYQATKAVIKQVAGVVVGNDASLIAIEELYKTSDNLDDRWTYQLIIYLSGSNYGFDPLLLKSIITNIHPAHCNLELVIASNPPFIWADENNPDTTDILWGDETTPDSGTDREWSDVY